MNVRGKRVLLTGATGGIGHAIARRLHAEGGELVLTGRRADVLEPLAVELSAQIVVADLAQADHVPMLVEAAGDVDVLVANAALPASGRLSGYSVEQIDRALDVNLRAPVVLTHALAPGMAARGGGHVVFISSISGKVASPYASLYAATKFGLRGFALALRAELREQQIGVSAVYPGFISDAGMFADAKIELPGYVRTRSPEQVADAVLRAIERNKAEVDVAPASVRGGALMSLVAPALSARVSRALGGDEIAERFESAQADKR